MVNCLLTISIKVNVLPTAESQIDRGLEMKKQTRGFWTWVLGGGWGGGGSNG
jgi:hypothetical protein